MNLPSEGLRARPGRRVRVLAADGQPLYRDAIARAIRERPELELVGQAGNGREALDAIGTEKPDVAVIDRALTGLTREQVLNAVAGEIRLRAPRDRPVMSQREREMLALIAEGLSAPQIGLALQLSTATVKT